MRYLIYLRVSTEEQKKSGLGIDAQLKTCLDYVKKHPRPYLVYKDEAVSSTLRMEDREQLTIAIDSLQKGDILLVSNQDRLSRVLMEGAILQYEIEKKGCRLVSVAEDYSGMDAGTATLMTSMIRAFAEFERYRIAQRTKKALQAKLARGERLGHIPYGFVLKDKKLEIEPYEADALRRMNNMRKKSLSFRDIASKLNEEGIKPRRVSKKSSGQWTYGAVCRVIKNYKKIGSRV
jgi:site-specific DNA recombinase